MFFSKRGIMSNDNVRFELGYEELSDLQEVQKPENNVPKFKN
jgi:hypothetical protein